MKEKEKFAEWESNPFEWYIITAVSGNEDVIVNNLWNKIRAYGFDAKVAEIKIIKEKEAKIEEFNEANAPKVMRKTKNITWETIEVPGKGKIYRKTRVEEKNKFIGYIFIKCVMDDDVWFLIRNTQMVTGIIGSSGKNTKPIPVGSIEIEQILNPNAENVQEIIAAEAENGNNVTNVYQEGNQIIIEKEEYVADFEVGSKVKVVGDNAMSGEIGTVSEMNNNKGIARVQITFFERESEVEFKYSELELVE